MGEMNIQKVMAAILEGLTDAQKEQVKACKDTNELIAKLSEMGLARRAAGCGCGGLKRGTPSYGRLGMGDNHMQTLWRSLRIPVLLQHLFKCVWG